MPIASKNIDWNSARAAFVERNPRPTYDELAIEFHCAPGAVGRVSSQEGWPALRASYLDAQLVKADASTVLLEACKADRTIARSYASLAVVSLARLIGIVESIPEERAAETKANAINTCMFAAKNLADALRSAGILGVSKTLNGAGKEDNGRWDNGLLQQINVNFTGLQQAVSAAQQAPGAGPTVNGEAAPGPAEPAKPPV